MLSPIAGLDKPTSPCRPGATSSRSTPPTTSGSTSSSRRCASTPRWSPARPAPAAHRTGPVAPARSTGQRVADDRLDRIRRSRPWPAPRTSPGSRPPARGSPPAGSSARWCSASSSGSPSACSSPRLPAPRRRLRRGRLRSRHVHPPRAGRGDGDDRPRGHRQPRGPYALAVDIALTQQGQIGIHAGLAARLGPQPHRLRAA